MRCVFSESLNRQTLGLDTASPPVPVTGDRVRVETSWRAVVRVLRSPGVLVHDLVTTVFPADCRCCAGPLLEAGPVPVCEACVGRVRRNLAAGCGRCGEAMHLEIGLEDVRFAGQMAATLRCRECRLAEPPFEQAVSYATYEGELRTLIQLLKFDRMPAVAALLGRRMAETIVQLEGSAAGELLVVAVPLFAARQRQRGYNQSVLLADAAIQHLRTLRPAWKLTAAHGLLRRVRRTESQFVLSKTERRRNLRGAFVAGLEVKGREVLVIDDIMTSGATARECARVLKNAGAARVWVATLARAQKHQTSTLHEAPGDGVALWGEHNRVTGHDLSVLTKSLA